MWVSGLLWVVICCDTPIHKYTDQISCKNNTSGVFCHFFFQRMFLQTAGVLKLYVLFRCTLSFLYVHKHDWKTLTSCNVTVMWCQCDIDDVHKYELLNFEPRRTWTLKKRLSFMASLRVWCLTSFDVFCSVCKNLKTLHHFTWNITLYPRA